MNIAIVGTGYVGLVSGTCFAEMGIDVTCVDVDVPKIEALRKGQVPIYEPGLEELIRRNTAAGRLHFTTALSDVARDVEIVFCAVGTPAGEDGSADLSHVLEVARNFGRSIEDYALFVTKSTVPVGTSELVRREISAELARRRRQGLSFDVASNPEFLKEGAAVKDFMSPDRVVVGVDSQRARRLMERLYRPFLLNKFRVIFMDMPSAEMSKYAANAMLATRISFINEIAMLCEAVGADVSCVRKAIGADARIGNKFLYPGCGYGGSCFPKDVSALLRMGQANDMKIIEAVEDVNEKQKRVIAAKLRRIFGGTLSGRRIAVWGLAFKPETDDMRCAPALTLIDELLDDGATATVYDPVAMDECRRRLGDSVDYASDMYAATVDADALVLLTEWKEFRLPSWAVIARTMRGNTVIDGRNIYRASDMAGTGLRLYPIGSHPDGIELPENHENDSQNA